METTKEEVKPVNEYSKIIDVKRKIIFNVIALTFPTANIPQSVSILEGDYVSFYAVDSANAMKWGFSDGRFPIPFDVTGYQKLSIPRTSQTYTFVTSTVGATLYIYVTGGTNVSPLPF